MHPPFSEADSFVPRDGRAPPLQGSHADRVNYRAINLWVVGYLGRRLLRSTQAVEKERQGIRYFPQMRGFRAYGSFH